MNAAVRAGFAYFAVVYVVGLVLGVLRVLVVAPGIGETAAVLVEIPVLLAVSWIACGHVLRRCGVGTGYDVRAATGFVAFGLLMTAEFLLDSVMSGRTLVEHLERYREPVMAIGLTAQMAFAAMPLFRR